MWKKDGRTAENIPDAAGWENLLQQITDGLQNLLQRTAASALTGLEEAEHFTGFHPVPVSRFLSERIASGGETVLSDVLYPLQGERRIGGGEDCRSPRRQETLRQRQGRTPYETARELQKQSELLLRT